MCFKLSVLRILLSTNFCCLNKKFPYEFERDGKESSEEESLMTDGRYILTTVDTVPSVGKSNIFPHCSSFLVNQQMVTTLDHDLPTFRSIFILLN